MDLNDNKVDSVIKPISNERISASEWNQLAGSCMEFITEAGLTPDENDNAQFLNAFKIIAANLELVGANTNLSNLTATGEAKFAAPSLSNVTSAAGANLNAAGVVTVVSTWHSGTEWYRIWSDGWCEQGGQVTSTSTTTVQITLNHSFADTTYSILTQQERNSTGSGSLPRIVTSSKTTATFNMAVDSNTVNYWEAKGYIS